MNPKRILIVDDEANMQSVLSLLFTGEGYETSCASNGVEALEILDSGTRFGLVVSDLKMDRMDGLELLRKCHEADRGLPFVLITAYGSIEKAVEAMKLGAVDVITKPFNKDVILNVVARAFRLESLESENRLLKSDRPNDEPVCVSQLMKELARFVDRVGPATAQVLLTGESGTGKEVISRRLHTVYCGGDFSARPFVSVNCPAVPEHLLESELFGYSRGAFTGADRNFKGKVEMADGGTLFFDEIGDLPASIQPKLLRLLENRTYEPLGSGKVKRVDIRVLCATNRNLKKSVQEGRFREDLYYRINTFTIHIPALRDRIDDIIPLAESFLERFCRETKKSIQGFSCKALEILERNTWPGNVRELKNVIERAVVLSTGMEITEEDLPLELRNAPVRAFESVNGNAIESAEKALIQEALKSSEGNISESARILGITRSTLRYRLKKYGMETDMDTSC